MQEISNNSAFKGYKEGMKVALALGLGAVVWSVFKVIAHTQDPTELLSYWQIGYPVSILLSGIMGLIFLIARGDGEHTSFGYNSSWG